MKNSMIVDAVKYAVHFIQTHFWALLKIVLVFMAVSIAVGLVVTGSSLILLKALSNNIWLTVVLQSPLLAVVGFVIYGMWHVSFITYLLALERTGSAEVGEHLRKSWSLRVLKIMAFDLLVVLFLGMIGLTWSALALGSWWFNSMQLALWHRAVLGISGTVLVVGMFYLLMRLFFTKIIIADTNCDMFMAFSVSWTATRGWFWRLFLMLITVGAISIVVTALAGQISTLLVFLTGNVFGGLLGKIIEVFAGIFTMVFVPLVALYYYVQLRVAKSLVAGR